MTMPSTRAALKSEEDHSWSPSKKFKRQGYLFSVIHEFLETRPELVFLLDDRAIADMTRLVVDTYELVRERIMENVSHEKSDFAYYDHHKIIAGTQCAVLMALPLRTHETTGMTRDRIFAESGTYLDVITCNADLAVYISLDILWNWYGWSPRGFHSRPSLMCSCTTQLVNYGARKKPAAPTFEDFPIFWCSMLWYTIEELLSLHQKESA